MNGAWIVERSENKSIINKNREIEKLNSNFYNFNETLIFF